MGVRSRYFSARERMAEGADSGSGGGKIPGQSVECIAIKFRNEPAELSARRRVFQACDFATADSSVTALQLDEPNI